MTRRDDTVVPFPRPAPDDHDLFDRFVQDVEVDPHSPMMRHILRARETHRTPTKSPEPADRHRLSVPLEDGGVYLTRDGWSATDITRQVHGPDRAAVDWPFVTGEFRQVLARPGKRKNDGRHWCRMARLAIRITSGVIGFGGIAYAIFFWI